MKNWKENKKVKNQILKINTMKNTLVLILTLCGLWIVNPGQLKGQSSLNGEISYFTGIPRSNGGAVGLEYEKYHTENLSLPLKAEAGFFVKPDYNSLIIEIHKGFRRYFDSGFFFEQSIGLGLTAHFYKVESIWYHNTYEYGGRYKDGANWGITPSIKAGAGYNLSHKKDGLTLIWIRPKVYWNLGTMQLNMPYAAVQIGFTHQLKSK